ncbi:LysR substrate-binding domain-containing protein [uncultured Deefgea sp.]|uniref:LysR substrate-binding domain-containing protein n=1 Tax=uncultured Deefgea sp. TaxID=1304914 RepID=UPI0035B675F0
MADWRPTPTYSYNDSNLELEAARLGHGIMLARTSLVESHFANGTLVQITDISVPYQYPYWLVWPDRSSTSGKIADFTAWIMRASQHPRKGYANITIYYKRLDRHTIHNNKTLCAEK